MLGVTRNTLYRWLRKDGIGEARHRDSRGWRLFTQDELEKLNKSINRVVKIEHLGEKGKPPGRKTLYANER